MYIVAFAINATFTDKLPHKLPPVVTTPTTFHGIRAYKPHEPGFECFTGSSTPTI